VDNAPENLKGAKGTNATIKNQPIIPLEYIYICIIIPNIHNCVSKYKRIPPPLMAGAPKPKNLKTTTQGYSTAGAPKLGLWREPEHSAAVMMYK